MEFELLYDRKLIQVLEEFQVWLEHLWLVTLPSKLNILESQNTEYFFPIKKNNQSEKYSKISMKFSKIKYERHVKYHNSVFSTDNCVNVYLDTLI